jgi:hypothetical protein
MLSHPEAAKAQLDRIDSLLLRRSSLTGKYLVYVESWPEPDHAALR